MEKIVSKPFEIRKKISLDINKEFLNIIDELVKLTHSNRTLVIESLIGQGIAPLFKYWEGEWRRMLNSERYKEKKKGVQKILQDLKKIKSKYKGLIYSLSNLPHIE